MRCRTFGISLIALLISASSISYASDTAAQFLNREKGARAAAMGDAFTNMSGDINTIFYNPCGLAFMEEAQVTGSYTGLDDFNEGMYGFSLAGGAPLYMGNAGSFKGVLGVGLQIENQGSNMLKPDEEFGKNWALALSYANHLPTIAAGLGIKMIHQELLDESDTSFALDLGVQYDLIKKFVVKRDTSKVNDPNFGIRLGAALQNLGTEMKWVEEPEGQELPRQMSFGISTSSCYRLRDMFPDSNVPLGLAIFRFHLALELTAFIDKLKKSDEDLLNPEFDEEKAGVGLDAFKGDNMEKNVGAEIWLFDVLALRAGYRSHPDMIEDLDFGDKLVYGLGLRFPISNIVGFPKTESAGFKQFDRFYRETDRQIFLEFDFSVSTDPGIPGIDRAKTVTLKVGI